MTDKEKSQISKNAAARAFTAFDKAYKENYVKYNDYAKGYGESLAIMESLAPMIEEAIFWKTLINL